MTLGFVIASVACTNQPIHESASILPPAESIKPVDTESADVVSSPEMTIDVKPEPTLAIIPAAFEEGIILVGFAYDYSDYEKYVATDTPAYERPKSVATVLLNISEEEATLFFYQSEPVQGQPLQSDTSGKDIVLSNSKGETLQLSQTENQAKFHPVYSPSGYPAEVMTGVMRDDSGAPIYGVNLAKLEHYDDPDLLDMGPARINGYDNLDSIHMAYVVLPSSSDGDNTFYFLYTVNNSVIMSALRGWLAVPRDGKICFSDSADTAPTIVEISSLGKLGTK